MGRFKGLKYLLVFTLPLLAYISFNSRGWLTFTPIIEAFLLVPFLELLFRPDPENLSDPEAVSRKNDWFYDLLVYSVVPIQCYFLLLFFESMQEIGLTTVDKIGRVSSMGLMCGVIGINVAHELGHRKKKYEQLMAKMLLLTSLYMHFFIEHNRGHHKNVSTPEDPSSARVGETLYSFWFRSVVYAYLSAWRLEKDRLAKKGIGWFTWHNEMLVFQIIQLTALAIIYAVFGLPILLYFLASAIIGFLLLETVNYIEHYGLQRGQKGNTYERVMPVHSWNSNHVVGRLLLFELSRHSDHHFIASRKYQLLRNMDNSPQMPTGYPGMMLLATIPPLWFFIMNKKIKRFQRAY
ncbi:MAG: alkane 1-monooxygenase [Cyclobacteriaceae bacterium]|jgi:alkane 1-monooxygenase